MYIWDRIVNFFAQDKVGKSTHTALSKSYNAKRDYVDTQRINFTAIFASKLANLAVSEAGSEVLGEDGSVLLNPVFKEVWRRAKAITAASLGVGGVFLIPYYKDGEIHTDVITQDRVFVEKALGGKIQEATILAESKRKEGKTFARWVHYSLEDNGLVITSMATAGGEVIPLNYVSEWENIAPEVRIPDCQKMIFAYVKSPADSRDAQGYYGVPITYGCESLIAEIHEHLEAIKKEYSLKQAFIGADSMLFSADGKLPEDGIFKMLSPLGSEKDFWQEFNPEIRNTPYYARLEKLYSMLESAVGTNRGILTELGSGGATATEIKRARYDTFSLVEEIRRSWEYAAEDLIYAYCVLLKFYHGVEVNDAKVNFDWSYSLFESSDETFGQLLEGFKAGVISKAELRQFLKPSENLGLAQEAVDKINNKKK